MSKDDTTTKTIGGSIVNQALSGIFLLLLTLSSAHAALLSRLSGQAYYDTALGITWLADANLPKSNNFGVTLDSNAGVDGSMSWGVAQNWVAAMNAANYLGVNNWRLPTILDIGGDGPNYGVAGGTDAGYNVVPLTSEMAHLHLVTLGNPSGRDTVGNLVCGSAMAPSSSCIVNSGPFSNLSTGGTFGYWAAQTDLVDASRAWWFLFSLGFQGAVNKSDNAIGAWAVRNGDIGSVVDTDGDGVFENADNCSLVANPTLLDADGDGYGNLCDADLNNSGTVTSADFGLMRSVLGQAAGSSSLAATADMNGSGTVTSADFGLLRARLGTTPGPSGLACAGTIPCP